MFFVNPYLRIVFLIVIVCSFVLRKNGKDREKEGKGNIDVRKTH